jgi:hypothetical protein
MDPLVPYAVVREQAEGVPGRVEQDPDIFLRLNLGQDRAGRRWH